MEEEMEISLQEIVAILWHKAWIILLCMVVGASIGFGISRYAMTPKYASRISMYVNNKKERAETTLDMNDINASQKLVATYIEILKSDKVLDKVIEKMALPYTNKELREMISATSVNGTEILEVKVTTEDPKEAAAIANTLSEMAPPEIIRVVQAGDVALIDKAVPNEKPVAPNKVTYTLVAALLGLIISSIVILVLEMLDISVKSVEDLQKHYDLPILGNIPDIVEAAKYNNK